MATGVSDLEGARCRSAVRLTLDDRRRRARARRMDARQRRLHQGLCRSWHVFLTPAAQAANWEAAKGAALWTVGCTAFLVGAERFCTQQLCSIDPNKTGPSWRTKVDRRFKVMIFGASFITGYWLYGETTLVKCGRQSTAR